MMTDSSVCDRCGETVRDIDAGFSPGRHAMRHDCGGTWRACTTDPETLASAIYAAADADGTVQAEDVVRIAPTRCELHSAIHWTLLADALACRRELDELAQ